MVTSPVLTRFSGARLAFPLAKLVRKFGAWRESQSPTSALEEAIWIWSAVAQFLASVVVKVTCVLVVVRVSPVRPSWSKPRSSPVPLAAST